MTPSRHGGTVTPGPTRTRPPQRAAAAADDRPPPPTGREGNPKWCGVTLAGPAPHAAATQPATTPITAAAKGPDRIPTHPTTPDLASRLPKRAGTIRRATVPGHTPG